MTKKEKYFLIISILALSIGSGALGYYYGSVEGMREGHTASTAAEYWVVNAYVRDQMMHADCEGAKKALLDYLAFLEKCRESEDTFFSGITYHADRMVVFTRLARIERHLKNKAAAADCMRMAMEACYQRNWKDCSEENLIRFSKQLEQKNPIMCLDSGE